MLDKLLASRWYPYGLGCAQGSILAGFKLTMVNWEWWAVSIVMGILMVFYRQGSANANQS